MIVSRAGLSRQDASRRARWLVLLVTVLAIALFATACGGGEEPPAGSEGDRITITIAVADDVNRRAALYAIEQGIAGSETVDLYITYLPSSAISDAASSKQFDVIEVSPLEVPLDTAEGPDLVVLSAGLQNSDGTLLFTDAGSDLASPADLRWKTLAVASLEGMCTLETRYLLEEAYGLTTGPEGDIVEVKEAPAESLPTVLSSGEADAAVLVNRGAFVLLEDQGFRVMGRVTDELQDLVGAPVMDSILVTYADIVEEKAGALTEVNRLLAESVTYFKANQDEVTRAVATEQENEEYIEWWWQRQELRFGDLSMEAQERLLGVWEMAIAVGYIEDYPDLGTVIFNPEAATPEPDESQ